MDRMLILLVLFSLFGCENSNKAIGHWHVWDQILKDAPYLTIDVINDTLAYIGKNSIYGSLEGVHNRREKQLLFPGECKSGHFQYEFQNDEIHLKGMVLGEHFIGYKCDSNCCNKVLDFTKDCKLGIDLPTWSGENLHSSSLLDEITETIVIGTPKSNYYQKYGDSLRIELSGEFATITDIELWLKSVQKRYNDDKTPLINYKIISDKHVLITDVKSLVEELKENKIEKIWLAYLNENDEFETQLPEYIPIGKLDFTIKGELFELVDF